jgi:ribosome-associated toxin RatA of RatAB toxin-antitoxin module
MPQIESTTRMNAPLDVVWPLAQDVENYPSIMPDLVALKILERQDQGNGTTRVVSEWKGRIKQLNRNIEWVEEDIWNAANHTCHFWQMRGDFSEYTGDYEFKPHPDDPSATLVLLKVSYRFDIPLLGALMQKVIQKIMQDNANGMLSALKDEAERRASASSG